MLKWAAVFFIFVVGSAVLGFFTLTGIVAEVVKFMFFVFAILFVSAMLSGLVHHPVDEPTRTSSNLR